MKTTLPLFKNLIYFYFFFEVAIRVADSFAATSSTLLRIHDRAILLILENAHDAAPMTRELQRGFTMWRMRRGGGRGRRGAR
jgi:hypothetical protein